MTILEKKSERKKKAIMQLVQSGEYSIAFAMMEAERLNDEGKLLDDDYEELAEWLESQLEPEEEPVVAENEITEEVAEEPIEEASEEIPNESEVE